MDFPFYFGPKSSLLLLFFFHGIVFSFLVFRKGVRDKNTASKWLGLLLFLYSMYIVPYMLGYAGWYSRRPTREILFFIPFMQVLLIGPVIYFYIRSLLNIDFKLTKKDYIHFLPAMLYGIYSLVVFITDKIILDDFYFYADGRDKDLATWYQVAGLISMVGYLILSIRYYFYYKRLLFDKVSYAEILLFQWIRNFMVAFLGLLLLRILFFILNPDWGEFGSQFWYYISFSIVFYYVALAGYGNSIKQIALASEKLNVINVFDDKALSADDKTELNETEKDIDLWKDRLSDIMKTKHLYRNPRLTLFDVANELDTTTKTVSSVVNAGFNLNFNDFVNHHRVEAVKEKLSQGEQKNTTILGLALDCGFNSKSTFNRAFKKSTGLSPKDFIKNLP